MVMSVVFTAMVGTAVITALISGNGEALSGAVISGAQEGFQVVLSMAGAVCLWSGVGKLMEAVGATAFLGKLFSPLLQRIFPSSRNHSRLSGYLGANFCANLLGLGNAATPMGISAAKLLVSPAQPAVAGDELCRLVVLNTASIQLLPATVGALRLSLGCAHPFDILPAVWLTSLCSVSLGLGAAFLLGKVWKA